ncbi:dual specificity phosphatase DUPD1, putative [Entamoeba dispar SAW760]|uniref:protein-tyrosine-phosphatase n=1 Tax=Entamoeba dispar (strain ATCC PRA-260 / SAW760) TaxID=370354 RepID=B0EJW2_ENTDS|nr:dual specificity phosphatase DUPD1, putative [Entamoeba dispar SAW760]EDR25171.1 dual specificity phosphatase DUPD1, putative [Entamoeba dispar SAW760]|eukprot:EDR25171.1 dual specificity phosphatase DUPD1, putative [Entamoeba dispar SAW760]
MTEQPVQVELCSRDYLDTPLSFSQPQDPEINNLQHVQEEISPEILQKNQEVVQEIEETSKQLDQPIQNETFPRTSFGSLPQLSLFDLRRYFTTYPVTSITGLNLSNNRMANLSLPNLISLKELNLSHNVFKKVPTILSIFTQLTRLDISYNYIKSLGILKTHQSIRYLDIHHNNIHKLTFDHYETASNLIHFDISDNYIASPLDTSETFYYTFPSIYFQRNPTFIIWGLYLGSVNSTYDIEYIKGLGIGCVLSVGKKPIHELDGCNLFITLEDSPKENIMEILQTALLFIDENIKRKRVVLVHCECGVSRSASIVIAYMMKKYDMTYKDALNFVSSKRKCVFPNRGFEQQLLQFEKTTFTFGLEEKEKKTKRKWLN